MEALQTRRCPHGKVMDDACYRCDAQQMEEGYLNELARAAEALEQNVKNGAMSPAARATCCVRSAHGLMDAG